MTSSATLARLPTAITADTNGNVLIAGNVGIGTSSIAGNAGNTFAIFGATRHVGNIILSNLAAGASGIYFADGTFQSTAGSGTGTGNYSNTNVASYLSGPVLVGNLYIGNATASTSTTTGSLITNGGAGIGGNLNVAGNIVTTGTSGNITGVNDLSTVTVTTTGNIRINTAGTGIRFADGTLLTTANSSFGLPGTIQYAGAGNTVAGNSGSFFWDAGNSRLGIGTASPASVLNVVGTSVPLFQTSNSFVGANNFEILVGNSVSTGTTVGYVNNTTVPYGYISSGGTTRTITIGANGRVGIGGITAPQTTFEVSGIAVIGATWAGNTNFINPPANGLAVQGRVGVGTYTPLSQLDVNGGIAARAEFSAAGAASVASLTSNGAVSGTTGTFTGALYGGSFNSAGAATVNSLVSNGSVTGTSFIPTGASVPSNGMYLITTNTVGFSTNSGEKMRISDLGNVAIGSTGTGNAKLTVQGVAGANTVGELYLTDGTQWLRFASNLGAGSYNGLVAANDQALLFSDGSPGTGALVIGSWSTGGAQGIRIDQTGNTSINLTSVTTGYRLDVGGSVRVAGGLVATGEVTAYFSDQRLKANITAITNAVDKVMAINGVYYNANDLAVEIAGEDKTIQRVGLLAQEVEAILPHVVKAAPFDIGDNGISKSGEHYKTLQYERIVPLLVEAIKEQQKTIDDLISRVSILESRQGGN